MNTARALRILWLVADLTPAVVTAVIGFSLIGFAIGRALWH